MSITPTPPLPEFSRMSYVPLLSSLIAFLKSDSDKTKAVQEVLYSGQKERIIEMLTSFGEPGSEWEDYKQLLPWAEWQIYAAQQDILAIKPLGITPPPDMVFISGSGDSAGGTDVVKFWAW